MQLSFVARQKPGEMLSFSKVNGRQSSIFKIYLTSTSAEFVQDPLVCRASVLFPLGIQQPAPVCGTPVMPCSKGGFAEA